MTYDGLPPPPPGYPPPEPPASTDGYLAGSPWTGGRFAAVLAAWFAGGIIGIPLAIALGFDPAEEAGGLAIVVLSQALGAFWVVRALSRKVGSGRLETDVGLKLNARDWKAILWGFGLQIVVAVLMAPVIDFLLDDPESRQAVTELAEETGDAGGRLLLILIFVGVAPFIEEIIFRGVMLSWLAKIVSARWAIVISAAGFAVVHLADPGAWPAVPGLFLIGLALGWAAVRRGSLSLAIFLHAGVNLLGSIVIMWEDEITDFLEDAQDNLEAVVFSLGIF
jgi:membrane protease YdiL (CAAX protease family)